MACASGHFFNSLSNECRELMHVTVNKVSRAIQDSEKGLVYAGTSRDGSVLPLLVPT